MTLSLFLALLVLGGQDATPPESGTAIIKRPSWAAKPTAQDILRVYPAEARRLVVGGKAVIGCHVRLSGAVEQCVVVSEEPQVLGFGAAAIKLSKVFKFTPELRNGVPFDGGLIKVPVNFSILEPDSPPTPLGYRQALNCVAWHSARLLFLPGNALSTAGLAKAEAAARVTGETGGKSVADVEADIANAHFANVTTFTRRGAPNATADGCARGF